MLQKYFEWATVAPCVLFVPCVMVLFGCTAPGSAAMTEPRGERPAPFTTDTKAAVVRYQVHDATRAVAFYTKHLGFQVVLDSGPVIAIVSRGDLRLILSGPDSSGSRPMPDGRPQEPGGWNRIVLYVDDLDSTLASLSAAGAPFRNQVEVGPGGRQVQVDDPDGNPIELHEAPRS
jgi:catechol 2,3-dioxygenase-like lactoylglutathione lyase family enzyme